MNIKEEYIVIRHSIREPKTNAKDSYRQRVTEEGVTLARELGKKLSTHSDNFIFFHSPVPRCEETANSIKKGIAANGKSIIDVKPFDSLGGFFYRNWDFCAELMNKQEFTRKWFDNEIPKESIVPIREAANFMLNEIINHKYKNVTKVFITHDWNVFCLKSLFFSTYEEIEVPTYLEGFIISENKENFRPFKQEHFTDKVIEPDSL